MEKIEKKYGVKVKVVPGFGGTAVNYNIKTGDNIMLLYQNKPGVDLLFLEKNLKNFYGR